MNSIHNESIKTFRSKLLTVLSVLVVSLFLLNGRSFAQGVGISESSITPDASAILELRSASRGFMLPRLATGSISSPVRGLLIYNGTTDGNFLSFYNGSWNTLATLASPTFTGTVTIPTPFTLGATSVTSTGAQLNYLSSATGTTGTTSTNLVFSTSPTLTTPNIGVATATSVNKVAITAPATSATITIADGKTLTASNTVTLTGTDGSSIAFGAGGTTTYTSNNLSVFSSTTSSQFGGVLSDETGSGLAVFGTAPTFASTITIGTAGGTTGAANLLGTTSGIVTIQPQGTAGTYNFNLPTTAGTSGQVLTSGGGGATAMAWNSLGGMSSITANAAATNATTVLTGATWTMPANLATVGMVIKIRCNYRYVHTAVATPTLTCNLNVAGGSVASFVITPISIASTYGGYIEGYVTIRTTGAGGTLMSSLNGSNNFGLTSALNTDPQSVNIATSAINTTTTNVISLTMNMTTAVAANTLTISQGWVEVIKP